MPIVHRVAVLGFSSFERETLVSYFRLAAQRAVRYEQVSDPGEARFIVADADHAPSVQLVLATERLADAVFIGAQAPELCMAWMARPIDPRQVLRQLDAMAGVTDDAAALPPPAAAPKVEASRATAVAPPPPRRPRPPPPAAVTVATAAVTPAAAILPVPKPTALLVDDSAIATRFLESRLERWGLEIARASNSSEALALLEEHDYDFVFLDVELGTGSKLDGLALCQHIKRNSHNGAAIQTMVVMVSAHQGELDRVRGALAGCDAYLGKPLDEVELQRLMMRHGLRAITPLPPSLPPSLPSSPASGPESAPG